MLHPHNVSVFFDSVVYTRFVSVHAEYSFPYTNSMLMLDNIIQRKTNVWDL